MMATALWFVGLLGLFVATLFASARARAMPADAVDRRIIAIAAAAYAALVAAAIWTWGGTTATTGRATQLHDGALVHLAIDGVRVPISDPIAIGHGATAAIRIPGDGPTGATDVARIEPDKSGGVIVKSPLLAASHGDDAAAATARGCTAKAETYTLPIGAAVVAVECDGTRPLHAFVIHSDARGEIRVAPLTWHGRFVAEQLTTRVGDVLRIGGTGDAIAGLTTWDMLAPHGAAAMLAIPADPTDCTAWLPDNKADGKTATRAAPHLRGHADRCVVEAGAFSVSAVALVPDADAVIDRGARAAAAIGGPPLILLVILALAPRRDRRTRALGRALRLCVLGASLTALCSWRLLWAYRIDMLRELSSVGPRLVDNQLAVIAIGAALAGNAALAHESLAEVSLGRRAFAGVVAWIGWLAVAAAIVTVGGTTELPALTAAHAGILGISLITALAPVLNIAAARATSRLPPELGLIAIAAGAVAGKLAAPRSALVKLVLAYAFVLAAHATLRRALAREAPLAGRLIGVALIGAAGILLARYDAGVTVAIGGIGLALAMLVAGHDAAYDASQAARIGVLEREHARLLTVHGAAGIAIAIGVAACALSATDRELIVDGAAFAIHAPLAFAALFVAAALIARSHRRGWVPWLIAAAAALTVWTARDVLVARATGADNVGARRVAAVLDPGYAVLRDERTFVANASAWREAALPHPEAQTSRWDGEGYFAARVRDLGVSRSIDNDYLPVLIARETGVAGLTRTIALLLLIALGGGAIASLRLRHASREHRARWLITAVVGGLAVYQPLAALGVLPLTGISWPGLGIDSPADIWLFVGGAVWCLLCHPDVTDDERVRSTARLRRARAVVLGALGVATAAAVIILARAGGSALGRVASEDDRIDQALRYAATIACPWPSRTGALADLVPDAVGGTPRDDDTARFDRELRDAWQRDRTALVAALPTCQGPAGPWKLTRDNQSCVATLHAGMPTIQVRVDHQASAAPAAPASAATASGDASQAPSSTPNTASKTAAPVDDDAAGEDLAEASHAAPNQSLHASCSVALSADLIGALRSPARAARGPRIRVVSEALGAASRDVGELVAGSRVVRLRPGTSAVELANAASGVVAASRIAIAGGVSLDIRATPRGAMLHGDAELFVAEPGQPPAWRRMAHAADVLLDRVTLIAAGPAEQRIVAVFRPAREWTGSPPVVDSLLADDTSAVGDRVRRTYPYGAALPELGWVNPFDVDHSLGLDGWIHAALRKPVAAASTPAAPTATTCGTLAPPAIQRDRVCSPSPLDGVLECRVALQPELSAQLHAIAERVLADPKPHTGRDVYPVRMAYAVLRGDTGELLAQGNVVPGRAPLAYAPADPAAETQLIQLRESHGEADAERVEWNLPIAVGSTLKPIVAHAAEQAFPQVLPELSLTAAGHATGCKAHRGVAVDPLLGHCPPSTLADDPTTSDLHDYLARSLNWYQAALGILGLGLPSGSYSVNGAPATLEQITASDLTSWPTTGPLQIADAHGPIIEGRNLSLDGLRRTPLWQNIESTLGRPLCTLGDRSHCEAAAERADVCAARALPIATASRDLRYLVATGPDRIDLYGDDRAGQSRVPLREYFQLLRGSGVHSVGSLIQLTDAFGRVIYDPKPGASALAASWFPAPSVGKTPSWSCAASSGHANTVTGADGGLCAVVQTAGTAHVHLGELLSDRGLVVYGAKTGTIDSLTDIARKPAACRAWNDHHPATSQLACGKSPLDDSLFVIAFGVITPQGTVPITLGIQLQRGAKGSAAHVAPELIRAIAGYLR